MRQVSGIYATLRQETGTEIHICKTKRIKLKRGNRHAQFALQTLYMPPRHPSMPQPGAVHILINQLVQNCFWCIRVLASFK